MARAMRWRSWAVAAAVTAAVLTACEADPEPQTDPTPPAPSASPEPIRAPQDLGVARASRRTVAERAEALLDGDRRAFLATLDTSDRAFRRSQLRYFANLQKLPLATYRTVPRPVSPPETLPLRGDAQIVVRTLTQLDGFDRRPVLEDELWTFVRGPGGRALLTGVRDPAYDALTGWLPTPWDVGRIVVRRDGPALAVFDAETAPRADALTSELRRAVTAVDEVVPDWPGTVVVYAISDATVLERLSALEVEDTGGVAFAVHSDAARRKVASWRFAVNPTSRVLTEDPGYLFRHELAHVALGSREAGTPVWLREGIAEYVAARPWSAAARAFVLDRTARGSLSGVTELPEGEAFYADRPTASYGIAWVAAEWLAETRGPRTLFRLLAAMRRTTLSSDADIDRVVRRVLGFDTRALATRAKDWATR